MSVKRIIDSGKKTEYRSVGRRQLLPEEVLFVPQGTLNHFQVLMQEFVDFTPLEISNCSDASSMEPFSNTSFDEWKKQEGKEGWKLQKSIDSLIEGVLGGLVAVDNVKKMEESHLAQSHCLCLECSG